MFLGHLFNGILLRDTSALGASGSSTKTSFLQRLMLGGRSRICLLLYSIGLLVSFFGNQGLENKAITAAKESEALDGGFAGDARLPSLDQMQKLEFLAPEPGQVERTIEDNGAPMMRLTGLGLYAGNNELLPQVRKAYYDRFRALLFGQTQKGLVTFMQKVPDDPTPQDDYGYAYDSVKSYLLTDEGIRPDFLMKALATFLGTTLASTLGGLQAAGCSEGRSGSREDAIRFLRQRSGARESVLRDQRSVGAEGAEIPVDLRWGEGRVHGAARESRQ